MRKQIGQFVSASHNVAVLWKVGEGPVGDAVEIGWDRHPSEEDIQECGNWVAQKMGSNVRNRHVEDPVQRAQEIREHLKEPN